MIGPGPFNLCVKLRSPERRASITSHSAKVAYHSGGERVVLVVTFPLSINNTFPTSHESEPTDSIFFSVFVVSQYNIESNAWAQTLRS